VADAASAPARELTARGLILGAALALILGAANAYLGLYAGMTVSASIPAAVISMAILRAMGGSTILENNFVQTVASAGEAVAAGAIFTFPAIVILGGGAHLPYIEVTALCAAGATIGSMLVVFLRRAYIVEEKLPFPEGVACAQVLRSAQQRASAAPLVWGGIASAALKAAQDIFGIVPGSISGAFSIGGAAFFCAANISGALAGVGYIIGIQTASVVAAGGIFAWLVAIPIATAHMAPTAPYDPAAIANDIWRANVRYLGVGAMLVGGAVTLWSMRARISAALAESVVAIRQRAPRESAREDTDLAPQVVAIVVALAIPVVFAICLELGASVMLSAVLAVAVIAIGFFATAIAGYLTGIVGASNNPVSGVTVVVLLCIALLMRSAGVASTIGPTLAILVGAIICTAAAMAGDSLHDLATGHFIGATPRSLEIGVLIGALVSSLAMAPILNLLISGYGIAGTATARAGALAAPQAFLMAKVASGVFNGGLPWRTIGIGAALAIAVAAVNNALERRGAKWRAPIMPLALGLYLPFGLSIAIAIGALVRSAVGARADSESSPGLLVASGLVAGEALMGVASGALVTAGFKLPIFG
jgi:putative OPT family oligopeptide transporter